MNDGNTNDLFPVLSYWLIQLPENLDNELYEYIWISILISF